MAERAGSRSQPGRPAVLGGAPAFADPLPFVIPFRPPLERVLARYAPSYDRGQLTGGPLVAELEEATADRLGVRHAVAVSSCTAGLMLVLAVVARPGRVALPGFTFSASAHAVAWNGLTPVFCECDPHTFQIDADDLEGRLAGITAILATHVFGVPCDTARLEKIAAANGAALVLDAAAAFGAHQAGRPVGRGGDAEVFSLAPTKLVVAGEGGLVTTDHDDVAANVRIGRNYANPGDYDSSFVGLNARLSEFHAATALESLGLLDEHLERRAALADRYNQGLRSFPGITLQASSPGDRPNFKELTVVVDPETFGLDRGAVVRGLRAEGIDTRSYFSPPVHQHKAYAQLEPVSLPVTEALSARVVSLPIYPALSDADVDRVVAALAGLHAHAEEIAALTPSAALDVPGGRRLYR